MVTSISTETGGGSGSIEDIAIGTMPQYIFFKVVQFSEDGTEEYAWTAPVWFQNQGEDTILTPGGGIPDDPAPAGAVASRRSNTFHVSMQCFDAQRISSANLVRGAEARRGRRLHQGCPRRTGPR
jgi:hypothetical protein